jgi:cytochrome b561
MKQNPSRYHPALVSLHWLLALLIMLAMGMSTFVLKEIPNTSPDKLGALQGHMLMGLAIGALMMVRLIVRLRTSHPRVVHGWIAKLLMALVARHVVGVAYHEFGLKDRLLSPMWFGQR